MYDFSCMPRNLLWLGMCDVLFPSLWWPPVDSVLLRLKLMREEEGGVGGKHRKHRLVIQIKAKERSNE
jgi:hypothetical protein